MASKMAMAYAANTNVLTLTGLQSEDEGTFLNEAAPTLTVKDSSGSPISGESWPVTMEYVAASDGNYRVIISSVVSLTAGQTYKAVVDVDSSTTDEERIAHWEFPFQVQTRTS